MRRFPLVLACFLLTACASSYGAGDTEPLTGPTAIDHAAVNTWRDFPAGGKPRPLVVTSDLPLRSAEAKADGPFEPAAELPAETPPPSEWELPDGSATVTAVSAAAAYSAMTRLMRPGQARRPAKVTGAVWSTGTFTTDRGPVELPAWRFSTDSGGSVTWPGLAPEHFWRLGELRASAVLHGVRLGQDGRTLVVSAVAPRACPGDRAPVLGAHAVESPSGVVVGMKVTEPGEGGSGCVMAAYASAAEYPVTLAEELGGRVVLDRTGAPVPVSPEGFPPTPS
ncbi:hypothetical protein HD597_007163 [Nonomuraea thailandensis]|uniref:Uncharacterized protein n=1 Tax=Nonomuraea thailandensis TaxID=1188745 RepID=A0A9X2K4K4_9ACTN|nr:hypothetical protein [Nonomuraea thailandensis]MCP2360143.1 hypothetical protein [Nonomuraea thailandensis]